MLSEDDMKTLTKAAILAAGFLAAVTGYGFGAGKTETEAKKEVGQTASNVRPVRKGEGAELILAAPAGGLEARPEDEANFAKLVWGPEKLKEEYGNVLIIDARAKGEYDKGHLPGAVQLHWNELIDDKFNTPPSDEKIAKTLAERGIDTNKVIVIYNDPLPGRAEETRLLWLFRYLGLENTFVLDGGLAVWQAKGGEVTKERHAAASLTPVSGFARNERLYISTDDLAAELGSVNILDARSDEEYAKSRIPGTKFVWFKDFYHQDGTFLTPAETRARVSGFGFKEGDEVVVYCRGGIRSSLALLALETAGYTDVRNYCASFSGWTAEKKPLDEAAVSGIPVYQ